MLSAAWLHAVLHAVLHAAVHLAQVQPLTRLVRLPLGARGSWTLMPVEPKYRGTVHTIRVRVPQHPGVACSTESVVMRQRRSQRPAWKAMRRAHVAGTRAAHRHVAGCAAVQCR
jgi:hypothetical protein